jgi:hypothetical protein
MSICSADKTIVPNRIKLNSPLELVEHFEDLLGEAHGFGSFLFDTNGQIIVDNGATWLYTTSLTGDKWESWTRPFNLRTMKAGPASRILVSEPEDHRGAVLHNVIRIATDLVVGFFSGGTGVMAAIATAPNAKFKRDHAFRINPVQGWETHGNPTEGWVLEANGAFVTISENTDSVVLWQGYDSYQAKHLLGDLAWAKIRVDKKTRRISLEGRHPENPLPFRDPSWSCARCGGNLNSNIRIDGRYVFFYYFRPFDSSEAYIAIALCPDPLFLTGCEHFVVDHMRGQEEVAEKFQVIQEGNELLVFSENRLKDKSWRTGMRRFLVAR